jgi:hypothetical protein
MTEPQTIYELRLACHKPGCPICTLVQQSGALYIEGMFSENMLDPGVRQKLVESQGFCYEHTWQSITLKLSDALGHAILYQDLVKDVMKTIMENEKITGSQMANALHSAIPCPACLIEESTLERIIDSLTTALRDKGFIAEFKQSSGLCIPHLRRLLPSLDTDRKAVVLSHQITCLEGLNGELAEFIRKSDYRFRDEVIGKEGDSYKRAADLIQGKHRLSEKKYLR